MSWTCEPLAGKTIKLPSPQSYKVSFWHILAGIAATFYDAKATKKLEAPRKLGEFEGRGEGPQSASDDRSAHIGQTNCTSSMSTKVTSCFGALTLATPLCDPDIFPLKINRQCMTSCRQALILLGRFH